MKNASREKGVSLPFYQVIQNELLDELSLGRFKVGDSFYTEGDLIGKFKVAKLTVRNALKQLEDEGYIYRRRGVGAFVASLPEKPQRTKVVKHCVFGVLPGKRGFKGRLPLVRILMDLHEEANKKGYMLYLGNDDVTPFIEAKAEGVITLEELEKEDIEKLKKSGIPVVSLFGKNKGIFTNIESDMPQAGYKSWKYLYKRGHKKILLLGGDSDAQKVERSFRSGILKAMRELDLPSEEYVSFAGAGAYDDFSNFLQDPSPLDALILLNGNAVLPAMQILNEFHLKVPDDVSILAHGEKAMDLNTSPLLSIIRHDFETAAKLAISALQTLLQGGVPDDALFGSYIVERGSCKNKTNAS